MCWCIRNVARGIHKGTIQQHRALVLPMILMTISYTRKKRNLLGVQINISYSFCIYRSYDRDRWILYLDVYTLAYVILFDIRLYIGFVNLFETETILFKSYSGFLMLYYVLFICYFEQLLII